MRKLCLGALAVFAALSLGSTAARAADHGDGTTFAADRSGDINDLYVWMNADASRINLAMTVYGFAPTDATFSDAIQYNFRLSAYPLDATAVATDQAGRRVRVTCTFDAKQVIQCWVVDQADDTVLDYVTGDASAEAGITSESGGTKVFAGLRNDPFFFNLAGFRHATDTVTGALLGGLTPEANGCYDLGDPSDPTSTAAFLIGQLTSGCLDVPGAANPGTDFFAPNPDATINAACTDAYFNNRPEGASGNTLAISVQIDKAYVVDDKNPVLGAWSSTNM